MKALEFRQKLIQLADHLQFVCNAINKYKTEELKKDEDNDKHLEKTKKVAKLKVLKCMQLQYVRERVWRA